MSPSCRARVSVTAARAGLLAQVAPVTASGAGETAVEMPAGKGTGRVSTGWPAGPMSRRGRPTTAPPRWSSPRRQVERPGRRLREAAAQVFRAADGSAVFRRVPRRHPERTAYDPALDGRRVTWAAVEGSSLTLPADAELVSFAAADATPDRHRGRQCDHRGVASASSDGGRLGPQLPIPLCQSTAGVGWGSGCRVVLLAPRRAAVVLVGAGTATEPMN